jgi:SAM-dependent methyltransferase
LAQLLSAREVYGVDISRRSAEMAERAGIKAKVIDLNAQPLPYPDGYFQGIFCGEVIEHLFDPDHLLDEVKRCLSADGLCVLTTPNLAAWYNRVALLLGAQPYSADVSFRHPGAGKLVSTTSDAGGAHLRLFTYRALKELLLRHGFRIVDVKGNSLGDCWDTATFSTRLKVIYNVVRPIDSLFAFVPSLSSDVTIALKVGKVRGTA